MAHGAKEQVRLLALGGQSVDKCEQFVATGDRKRKRLVTGRMPPRLVDGEAFVAPGQPLDRAAS